MTEALAAEDLRLEDFDFDYPESLIASEPASPRDSSRLLVLGPSQMEHARFSDLPRYLKPGDCLVLNRTRVLQARLVGRKSTGGKAELLLVSELSAGRWTALSSNLKPGAVVELPGGRRLEVEGLDAEGQWVCRFDTKDVAGLLAEHGLPPLPPYILKRKGATQEEDRSRYQTVYAREEGSIAAPTAGLHFTPGLLSRLREGGVRIAELVLHVGRGTFKPITTERIRDHRMLPERFEIPEAATRSIQEARGRGGRIVAVGTTSARSLETWAATGRAQGSTELFIAPGHAFKAMDAFITNFHLPRSTPLVLASAFAGRQRLLDAYRAAIADGYRLYSYGDAMLIL